MTRILIVEDEQAIRRSLEIGLRANGYEVLIAADGRTAVQACTEDAPDLVLLDLGLPDLSGFEVLRALRTWSNVPVIVLSARHGSGDKVDALDLGADDYVTKPFGLDELHARIRVALRRAAGPDSDRAGRVVVGPLVFDAARHEVAVGGRPVDLTPREFELLRVLLAEQGRVVTKGKLLRAVWGQAYQGEDSYVYVHVSQLRHKLAAADPDGELRDLVVTEPGVGYRVRAPDPAPGVTET
jgi:two-component system KDP operon response regulator KdpE